ncbi:ribonuclease III [Sphingomonas sp. LaA6.9]|uniref:ribonuclease III n=1 Tax=Sphingomonas sp. LaA6.9 TaxID=2919914 RepID=UPI001F4F5DD3|nr:ribonuclease III [Sphingomonas sp. LaA6.9]MCJ8159840.1 ribonuclease III [Sphingomonas sp. LaA6.9]
MVHRGTLEPDRGRLLSTPDLGAWITQALGHAPGDIALFTRAVTHGSHAGDNYERLEFLGDRVLALVIAEWLYAEFPDEPEGKLSRRLNALVTRESCAMVGREIGVVPHLRLGKQARDDGAAQSDNVVGDVVEALIGALYLEGGPDAARSFIRRAWSGVVRTQDAAPKHPKSELQEWAAAHNRKPPVYEITDRSGPHHSPKFTVTVTIGKLAEASATGTSKQEAETAAARALLEKLR